MITTHFSSNVWFKINPLTNHTYQHVPQTEVQTVHQMCFFSEHGVAYVCQIRFSFYRVHNQTCSFGELPRLHKPTFGHIPPYPISFVFYYVMIGIHTHNFVGQINEPRKPHVCSMVASICTKFQICAQYPSFCAHYSTKNT